MKLTSYSLAVIAAGLLAGAATAQNPFASAPVDDAELGKATGREDIHQLTKAELQAGVANNSINGDSTTGTINIDGQSFQNMSGLSVLNANTGNNVAINSSMQVNVALTPGM